MSQRRRFTMLVAFMLVIRGIFLVFRPTAVGIVVPAINILYVSAVGIAALALALGLVIRQSVAEPRRIEPATLPTPSAILTPGSRIDAAVVDSTDTFRETISECATEILANALDIDDETARTRLTDGDWLPDELDGVFESTENTLTTRPERRLRTHIAAFLAALADVTGRSLPTPERPDGPSLESRLVSRLAAVLPAFAPADRDRLVPTGGERRDPRITALRVATLCSLAAGVLVRDTAPFFVAVVGATVTWYVHERDPPDVSLDVARKIDDSAPSHGDTVGVTVTVRNSSGRFLPDLRLADGVPSGIRIVEGSSSHATALAPGRGIEFSYVVRVTRGDHQFNSPTAESRGFTSLSSDRVTIEAVGDATITCLPPFASVGAVPLRARTTNHVGRNVTDTAGTGIEFNAIREYQPGDPLSRVDWNRLGRTGRLATLQFSEERAARVFLVVDARAVAHRTHDPDASSAVERSVEAAGRVAASLFDENERVGLTALAPTDCWLASGSSGQHRFRLERTLATHPALGFAPPSEQFLPTIQRDRLRRRIPGDAQLIVFSPLLDAYVMDLILELDALGTPATVISPDPTVEETVGEQFATLARASRIDAFRRVGVPVLDWAPDEPLTLALARLRRYTQ